MDQQQIDAIAAAVAKLLQPVLTQPRLMTVKQAAVYMGRTEKGIYCAITNGSLPSVRTDARVMLDRVDLDKLIERSKV